ncbi:MAG: hypothetical protein II180_12950, partial [Proteobacteria bacterium]|nr:hypothetical protein [Pseudomonadota bacterium]
GLTPLELADYCTEGQFSAGKLTISSGLDFLQLRQILAASEGTLGHACDSATWIPQCTADGAALTVCRDGLLIQRSCSCLESDDGVATCDESTLDIERNNPGTPLEIIVDGTINLGDVLDTTVTGDVCEGPHLSGVRLDNVQLHGEHHASIIFQKDGMRCALKDALFTGIALSEVSGLILDYDVFGHVRGALANDVRGSDISDVVFMGNMYSLSAGNVGGVIGDASPISNTDIERPVSLRDVVSSGAIIEAGRAQSVGGAIGKITKGEYTQINLQNEIQSLRGQGNVGGLVGFLADGNIHHVNNRVKTLICDNSSALCGGFAGQIELGERGTLTDIRNEVTEITGTSNIYVGGFAGQLSYTSANAHLGKVANILTIGHSLQGNPVSGVYASLNAPSNGSMNMSNIVSAARLFNTNHTEIYVPMFVSSVGSSFSVSDYYWYGGTNAKATTSGAYTTGQITSDTTSEALSEIVTTLNNNTTNLELQGVWSVEKIALGPAGSPISVTLPQLKIQ